MKNRGTRFPNGKLRGEWAEVCFMARALAQGLHLNKPWGEMTSYDFVVGHGRHFSRVQVKSTTRRQSGGYCCNVRSARGPYVGDAFDLMAILVVPEDVWYIIPAEKVRGQSGVMLRPQLSRAKYERYKEAWDLLRTHSSGEGTIPYINACAEELFTMPEGPAFSGYGFDSGVQDSSLGLRP
jgi:hypothetical protein